MYVHPVLKKKWFWIGLVGFVLFAIIFDIVAAISIMVQSLSSGRWAPGLLTLGIVYAMLIALRPVVSVRMKKTLGKLSRALWITNLIFAINLYGFRTGLYFILTITLLSRFLSWGIKLTRKISNRKPRVQFA